MGKAVIHANRGAGLWGVNYKYAFKNAQDRLDKIDDLISDLQIDILEAANDLDDAEDAHNVELNQQNIAINQLNVCVNSGGCNVAGAEAEVRDKTKDAIESNGELTKASIKYRELRARELAIIKEKAFIQNYTNKEKPEDIWCVDLSYLIIKEGELPTAELFNNKKHGAVLLPSDTTYDCAEQGLMSGVYNLPPLDTDTAAPHADHYMLEWGNANWESKYISGELINIDRDNNTGEVYTEGVGKYPNPMELTDCEFIYMGCHHQAFKVGDNVVINLDWSLAIDGENPSGIIIGFVDNPRACPSLSGLADPIVPDYKVDGRFSRYYPAYSEANLVRGWYDERFFFKAADSIRNNAPGRFSGEMRAVVQDHHSRGYPAPYDYGNSGTHGIFTAGDNSKWVIYITDTTVKAWPLLRQIVVDAGNAMEALGYIPIPSPNPLDDSVIDLGIDFSLVTSFSKFFPGCGWAFSASGKEAANVFTEERSTTDNPATGGLTYSYSRMYIIQITEQDGKPSTADVQEVEAGWLYGDRQMHPKFPDYANDSLKSFDWFRGHPSPPWADGADNIAPIHCYYEGEVLSKCLKHNYGGNISSVNVANPGFNAQNVAADLTWGNYNSTTGIKNCFDTPVFGIFLGESVGGSLMGSYEFPDTGLSVLEHNNEEPTRDGRLVREKELSSSSTSSSVQDAVIVPLNDRESIGHYRKESADVVGGSVRYPQTAWFADVGDQLFKNKNWNNTWFSDCQPPAPLITMGKERDLTFLPHFFGNSNIWGSYGELQTNEFLCASYYYGGDNSYKGGTPNEAARAFTDANGYRLVSVSLGSIGSTADGDERYNIEYIQSEEGDPITVNNAIIHTGLFVAQPRVSVDNRGWRQTGWTSQPSSSASEEAASFYINETEIALPVIPTETRLEWIYYITDVVNYFQWYVVAVDASNTVSPIYMEQPMSSRSPWEFIDQLTGPADYPIKEIRKIWVSWIGEP